MISAGAAEPSLLIAQQLPVLRNADVFSTETCMESVAVSFYRSFCSSSIALIPNGVATLPSMKFAVRFITIAPMALSLFFKLGKRGLRMGCAAFAKIYHSHFSMIFIKPDQRHIIPSNQASSGLPAGRRHSVLPRSSIDHACWNPTASIPLDIVHKLPPYIYQ